MQKDAFAIEGFALPARLRHLPVQARKGRPAPAPFVFLPTPRIVSEHQTASTKIPVRVSIGGHQLDRIGIGFARFIKAMQILQDHACIVPGFGKSGFDPDSLSIRNQRIFRSPHLLERDATIEMGIGIAWIQRNGGLVGS